MVHSVKTRQNDMLGLFIAALSVIILCAIFGGVLLSACVLTGMAVEKIEKSLPPSRHCIEQLPAEETLLRASTEPTEGQEKVLLRAATGSAETPPEQLLRPDVSPAP
jgi:hypothetical protein